MTLKERVLYLEKVTRQEIRHWHETIERKPRWSMDVSVGRWTLARVRIMQGDDGPLHLMVSGIIAVTDVKLDAFSYAAKTPYGEISPDAEEAFRVLLELGHREKATLRLMVEEVSRAVLTAGLPEEDVRAAVNLSVVQSIMEL